MLNTIISHHTHYRNKYTHLTQPKNYATPRSWYLNIYTSYSCHASQLSKMEERTVLSVDDILATANNCRLKTCLPNARCFRYSKHKNRSHSYHKAVKHDQWHKKNFQTVTNNSLNVQRLLHEAKQNGALYLFSQWRQQQLLDKPGALQHLVRWKCQSREDVKSRVVM